MRRRNGQEGVAMITIMMIVVVLTLLMVATLNYAMQCRLHRLDGHPRGGQ